MVDRKGKNKIIIMGLTTRKSKPVTMKTTISPTLNSYSGASGRGHIFQEAWGELAVLELFLLNNEIRMKCC